MTLALTIDVVEIGVTLSGMTLTAQAINATWQWLDCNGFLPIPGATSAVFTPGKTGFYAVQVTQNGCVDTSECKAVIIVSTVEPGAHVSWLLAPNPADDAVALVFSEETPGPCEVQISDLSGKIYRRIHIPENTLQFPVDVKDLPPGIWLFGMTNGIARTVKRLVKVDAQ